MERLKVQTPLYSYNSSQTLQRIITINFISALLKLFPARQTFDFSDNN